MNQFYTQSVLLTLYSTFHQDNLHLVLYCYFIRILLWMLHLLERLVILKTCKNFYIYTVLPVYQKPRLFIIPQYPPLPLIPWWSECPLPQFSHPCACSPWRGRGREVNGRRAWVERRGVSVPSSFTNSMACSLPLPHHFFPMNRRNVCWKFVCIMPVHCK